MSNALISGLGRAGEKIFRKVKTQKIVDELNV